MVWIVGADRRPETPSDYSLPFAMEKASILCLPYWIRISKQTVWTDYPGGKKQRIINRHRLVRRRLTRQRRLLKDRLQG